MASDSVIIGTDPSESVATGDRGCWLPPGPTDGAITTTRRRVLTVDRQSIGSSERTRPHGWDDVRYLSNG